jgi:2-keto-4-pentenoate hydratase
LSNANNSSPAHEGLSGSGHAISEALVRARASAAPLTDFPGVVPTSMDEAYAIQSASIERWPDTIGGWKVGGLPPAAQKRYSTERLAGPIFRSRIHEVERDSATVMSIFDGGFAAVEAEFIFRFSKTVKPSDQLSSDDDFRAVIAGLHVGAEIASSPIVDINGYEPTVVVSDFGNNSGLLVGPSIPNWSTADPSDLSSKTIVDGAVVGENVATTLAGGPMAALRFIIALCAHRGIELPAGVLISTGATTGIHEVTTSSEARVEFGQFGGFDVTFAPMSGSA